MDVVVRGEGEWTMLELIDSIFQKKPLSFIRGITIRSGNVIKRNPPRPFGNLGELPDIKYNLLNKQFLEKCDYTIVPTRGCPFNCLYCSESKIWKNKIRTRKVQQIISEVKYISTHFNTKKHGIRFLNSIFNVDRAFFQSICSELQELDVGPISVFAEANLLPEKDLKIMQKAGIKTLLLGAESGSTEILRFNNKKITFQKVIDVCKKAKKHSFRVHTFWQLGLPGETLSSAHETIDKMKYLFHKGLTNSVELSIFIPYPGTPPFHFPQKYGINILSYDWEKYSRFDEPISHPIDIPPDELRKLHRKAVKIIREYSILNQLIDQRIY